MMIDQGSPLRKRPHAKPFHLLPGSGPNFAWMRKQLQNCRESHDSCRKAYASRRSLPMPLRLIDVGPVGAGTVYFRETEQLATKTFATASYVWGTADDSNPNDEPMMTKSNLQTRMKEGIPVSRMPRTIRDLIIVAQGLGVRYLWIDAFCIVQDDKDEKEEINQMAKFYERSEITICAAMASHCGQGFLQPRDPERTYGPIYEFPYSDGREKGTATLVECPSDDKLEPAECRAWIHQEIHSSLRILFFASKQVRWMCDDADKVDGGWRKIDNAPDSMTQQGMPPEGLTGERCQQRIRDWLECVHKYSNRDITRRSDRVPALGVEVEAYARDLRLPQTDFCCGIWRSDALRQLLWDKCQPQKLEDRDGPSWSWVSLLGQVDYSLSAHYSWPDCYESKIVHFPNDPKGDLHLLIRGQTSKVEWDGARVISESVFGDPGWMELHWDVTLPAQTVWLLKMIVNKYSGLISGLILMRSQTNSDSFERCGTFELTIKRLGKISFGQRQRIPMTFSWSVEQDVTIL